MSALEIRGFTDRGLVRPNNEDGFGVDAKIGLMVVADGMGGHRAGEVASALAVSTILDLGRKNQRSAENLKAVIQAANAEIFKRSLEIPQCAGMGTTAAVLWMGDKTFLAAHVGDSRAYAFSGGRLTRLTRDHSEAQERVSAGLMTESEAASSGLGNVLTRALGSAPEAAIDVSEHDARPGDVLILATDGLTKMADDDAIAGVLARGGDAERLARGLVELALKAGGQDNVTVVAARAA